MEKILAMRKFHFSMAALMSTLLLYGALGILVVTDQVLGSPYWGDVLRDAALGFYLIGSLVIIVRMSRSRGHSETFWRVAHAGQLSVLPAKWRSWILGENDRS
jgi:hypothetical protein